MKKVTYAVYGASGFGREVMPLARDQLLQNGVSTDQLVFIDDNRNSDYLNGYAVLTYEELLNVHSSLCYIAVAIADGTVRKSLVERISSDGMELWQVVAKNVVIMDQVKMAEGGILCPFVTLTSNIMIGKCFHANIYSYVAHDCLIGDYVTFAPGVKCNGNVVVEDHAYIGTGAIIKQGRPGQPLVIGKHAVIGMGAVVTKSVPAGVTVVGNPAGILNK
jgi:sugar O-acyltransferase (sialic acid O-acetyltransferase NeuD family)